MSLKLCSFADNKLKVSSEPCYNEEALQRAPLAIHTRENRTFKIGKTMQQRAWNVLLAVWLCVLGALMAPGTAQAASGYDNLLHVSSALTVYTDGAAKSQTQDISQRWWNDFKQTYQKRLNQNLGWPGNFVADMDAIIANGSWGVYTTEYAEGKVVNIIGTSDSNASCSFYDTSVGEYFGCTIANGASYLKTEYFTHSSFGGNGCWGSGGDRCSDNSMNVYSAPTYYPTTGGGGYWGLPIEALADVQFYMMNFNIAYPAGYEGEIIPSQRKLNYVAMGDSFSSGEGVEPFITGTDNGAPSENRCHRSENAYPRLLDQDNTQKVNLELTAFVACSGATTDTLLNGGSNTGSWGEGSQLDALSSTTDVVTLTIGGNDVGFTEVLRSCIQGPNPWASNGWGCASNATVTNALDDRMDALEETSETVVTSPNSAQPIHTIRSIVDSLHAMSPNAKIHIAGYPHLFGSSWVNFTADAAAPGLARCSITIWGGTISVSYADAQWMNDQVDTLNSIISNTVIDAKGQGVDIEYVAPNPFTSHALCDSGASYIYSLFLEGELANPTVLSKSFHPTTNGISAYKLAFGGALN